MTAEIRVSRRFVDNVSVPIVVPRSKQLNFGVTVSYRNRAISVNSFIPCRIPGGLHCPNGKKHPFLTTGAMDQIRVEE
jgi:hypothetical protein